MQSYFCPACKTKSLMANWTLKNNKGENWSMCVFVHPDVWAADLSSHLYLSHSNPPHLPSSNHFCNSDLTLWAVQSMLLIKRKLVFIFKLHHHSRLIAKPSLERGYNDFMLKLLFYETIKFFRAVYEECQWLLHCCAVHKEGQAWLKAAVSLGAVINTPLFQMLPRWE